MTHHKFAVIISAEPVAQATTDIQQPYDPPAVVYEAALEVRAGTPVTLLDVANPLNL